MMKHLKIFPQKIKIKKQNQKIYFFFLAAPALAVPPMILNMVVLHLGQLPFNALRVTPPLPFMATSLALEISRFILHLTQYPVSPIFNTSFLLKNVINSRPFSLI